MSARLVAPAVVATVVASLLVAPPAGEPRYSRRYRQCMDKSEGVTSQMLDCIAEETKAQDGRLNNAYRKLAADLGAERKNALQQAQRLWIQYRDANCGFYADPEGGTASGLAGADCVLRMTAERADELEALGGK